MPALLVRERIYHILIQKMRAIRRNHRNLLLTPRFAFISQQNLQKKIDRYVTIAVILIGYVKRTGNVTIRKNSAESAPGIRSDGERNAARCRHKNHCDCGRLEYKVRRRGFRPVGKQYEGIRHARAVNNPPRPARGHPAA
jgi:hypothetical protein